MAVNLGDIYQRVVLDLKGFQRSAGIADLRPPETPATTRPQDPGESPHVSDLLQKPDRSAPASQARSPEDPAADAGTMAKLGLAMTGAMIGQKVVSTISDFGKAMSGVNAVMGKKLGPTLQAQQSNLKKLSDLAREMGAATVFTAGEAASAMETMARSGRTVAEIMAGIKPSMDLAAAGALDLTEATDILVGVMSTFELETNQASRAADTLANIAAAAKTDVSNIGDAMKFTGNISRSLGVSLEQTSAMLGVLAKRNLEASMAGTGLRKTLADLNPANKKLGKLLHAIGKDFEDVNVRTHTLKEVFTTLKEAGIDKVETALAVFGQRAGNVASLLAENADEVDEFFAAIQTGEGAAGMASKQLDNLWGDLKKLTSAFEELILKGGESGLTASLRTIVQVLADLTRALAGATDKIEGNKTLIIALAEAIKMLVAMKLAMWVMAGVRSIGAMIVALKALRLAVATNPVGLFIVALTTLIPLAIKAGEILGKLWGGMAKHEARAKKFRKETEVHQQRMVFERAEAGTLRTTDLDIIDRLKLGEDFTKEFGEAYTRQVDKLRGKGKGEKDTTGGPTVDDALTRPKRVATAAEKAASALQHELALMQAQNDVARERLKTGVQIAHMNGETVKATELEANANLAALDAERQALDLEIQRRQAMDALFTKDEAQQKKANAAAIALLQIDKEQLTVSQQNLAHAGAFAQIKARTAKAEEAHRKAVEASRTAIAQRVEMAEMEASLTAERMRQAGATYQEIELASLQTRREALELQQQQLGLGDHEAAVLAKQLELLDAQVATIGKRDQLALAENLGKQFTSLFDAFDSGFQDLGDKFTNLGQNLIQQSLAPLMRDIQAELTKLFNGMSGRMAGLVNVGLGAAAMGIGALFQKQKAEVESLGDSVKDNIQSTERVRGLIAGEQTIAVAKMSENLGMALRPTNSILSRMDQKLAMLVQQSGINIPGEAMAPGLDTGGGGSFSYELLGGPRV
jgi:TP901 family phage tail tape measure protein